MQHARNSFGQALYELLSSMRFAVSLLTVLAIASIIGTVLKQNEPYVNYLAQFGQFWFNLFQSLELYDVYHAGWFLAILFFLVLSTSFCIYRNAPLMLREMRSYREHATEKSLRHFSHRAELSSSLSNNEIVERLTKYLSAKGYRAKINQAETSDSILIAAKAGSYQRLGYIFTHLAIVIICAGGLIDGNLPLKIAEIFGYKKIETRNIAQSQIPQISRLDPDNLSFRGNVTIPEGSSADVVFLNVKDGYLVQDLPFEIRLKKFYIDHYTTGQPKSFASDLVLIDKQNGHTFSHTITVNNPLIYKGIAIYQASFGDGGSKLKLNGWNLLTPTAKPFTFEGTVKREGRLSSANTQLTIEFTEFRPFNIENMGDGNAASVEKAGRKDLRNVGPSFDYKIRDAQGQAREYNNYMLPLLLDNRWFLVSGMRTSPNEPLRYIRFPLDQNGTLDGFMYLRAVLFDKEAHSLIAQRFADAAFQAGNFTPEARAKVVETTIGILSLFTEGGFDELARFIDKVIPKPEQQKMAEIYLKILDSAALHAYQLSQERLRQQMSPPSNASEVGQPDPQFMRDSLNSISDLFFYGAPVYFQLTGFEQVNATGLQLTRSPGKNIVYFGSVLLILGVFAMFYIRERRIWLLIKSPAEILFAISANRKTLDFENEFEEHKRNISSVLKASA